MKPFQLIQEIAKQAQENASPLPQPERMRQIWDGISYQFGGIELVSPLAEISEISPCPPISLLPGVQQWVRGIANIRGNLITVVDLAAFLELRPPSINKNSRIMVINKAGVMAGVLVDEVYGLRHYDYATQIEQITLDEPKLIPYVKGGFATDEQEKIVLSLFSLIQSQEFINIAA